MAEREVRWQGVSRHRLDYVVQPVADIATIRSILAPRVEYTAYALGQLEPALFPRTRWFYARGTTGTGLVLHSRGGLGDATFVLALVGIALRFEPERLGPQFVATVGGALSHEPRLLLGVDGIGLCFLISTAGLVPIALLTSRRETEESVRSWIFVVLMLESSLLGAITSLNLHGFLYFWAQSLPPILVWLGR